MVTVAGRRRSSAGAVGIAQWMPHVAAHVTVDPLNPEGAVRGAAGYVRYLVPRCA